VAELPYKTGPVTFGDRVLLGFGGALTGFFTGLLVFLMVNWLMLHLDGGVPQQHYLAFRWVWRITAFCAVFAFLATETFVRFISAVWDAMGEAIRFLWGWNGSRD
jgi:hypothetical protein